MRVLVTGHEGYIGAVLVPMLRTAGHEAVGLDTGFYVGCDFGPAPEPVAAIDRDLRDVTPDDLEGIDAVVHLAAISNDPVGHLNPETTYEINAHASIRSGGGRQGRRRPPFPVLVLVQPVRRCRRRGGRRGLIVQPRHALRPVEDHRRGGDPPPGRRVLLAGVAAQRDRVRDLAPPARRHRDQQPRRLGAHHRRGAPPERRPRSGGRWSTCATSPGRSSRCSTQTADAVHDQAFNVGRDDNNLRIREVAELVEGAVPGSRVTFAPGAGTDARDYRVDFGKLRRARARRGPRVDGGGGDPRGRRAPTPRSV